MVDLTKLSDEALFQALLEVENANNNTEHEGLRQRLRAQLAKIEAEAERRAECSFGQASVQNVVFLDNWSVQKRVHGNETVVAGIIYNHPRLADGTRIITEPLIGLHQSPKSLEAITTKRIYQLRQPDQRWLQQLQESDRSFEEYME